MSVVSWCLCPLDGGGNQSGKTILGAGSWMWGVAPTSLCRKIAPLGSLFGTARLYDVSTWYYLPLLLGDFPVPGLSLSPSSSQLRKLSPWGSGGQLSGCTAHLCWATTMLGYHRWGRGAVGNGTWPLEIQSGHCPQPNGENVESR